MDIGELVTKCDAYGAKDLPTLMMELLSGDWMFFADGEIAWDGHRHSIVGIQVNATKAPFGILSPWSQ